MCSVSVCGVDLNLFSVVIQLKAVVLLSVSSLSDCFGLVAVCPFVAVFC